MLHLHLDRDGDAFVLYACGLLEGSGAWRLCRVAARLSRRRPVYIDLDGIERLLTFGAAVLGARLPQLAPRVRLRAVRPEHERLLQASGALLEDAS